MGAISLIGAKVLAFLIRGSILLARIRVGSAWIRKRCEACVHEKHWFFLYGALKLARIHLDPEVWLFIVITSARNALDAAPHPVFHPARLMLFLKKCSVRACKSQNMLRQSLILYGLISL